MSDKMAHMVRRMFFVRCVSDRYAAQGVRRKRILKLFYKNVCNFYNLSCKMSDYLVKYSHGD